VICFYNFRDTATNFTSLNISPLVTLHFFLDYFNEKVKERIPLSVKKSNIKFYLIIIGVFTNFFYIKLTFISRYRLTILWQPNLGEKNQRHNISLDDIKFLKNGLWKVGHESEAHSLAKNHFET
jgi:hypothetical protein